MTASTLPSPPDFRAEWVAALERLAEADAFASLGVDRRQALWDARALKPAPDLPLFAAAEARDEGVGRGAEDAAGEHDLLPPVRLQRERDVGRVGDERQVAPVAAQLASTTRRTLPRWSVMMASC